VCKRGDRREDYLWCNIFRDMQVTTPSPVYILIYDIECSERGCLLPAAQRWETEYTHRLLARITEYLRYLPFLEQMKFDIHYQECISPAQFCTVFQFLL
jgi:hypothetical protein